MLAKFRNRFIILIMSFTTVILVSSFVAIYISAYIRIHAENKRKLNSAEELIITAESLVTIQGTISDAIMVSRIYPDIGMHFNLIVSITGELLLVDSALELPYEVYEQAASIACNGENGRTVELEERKWMYLVTSTKSRLILSDGMEFKNPFDESGETYLIRYLDVTDSHKNLWTIMITLLSIGPVMLLAFFFLSCYIANRAMKPMAVAWEKQNQFVTDASHELKTPLSIVNANIAVLYANKEDRIQNQLKWLDYIAVGTNRMTDLVNNLLSLSKIEDFTTRPYTTEVNIKEVLEDATASFMPAAELKDIHITKAIPDDIMIHTDPDLIRQAINILLDNAIKYSDPKGCVEIRLEKINSHISLSVKNGGRGIKKQDLPKVFDRFYRADASRNSNEGGYGLGLSIAKIIMSKLGGTIQAESVENAFTIFTLNL